MNETAQPPGRPLTASERTSARIRAHMKKDDRRQSDLAEHLGISIYSVSRRLNGRHDFKLDELETIAAWLGVQVGQLAIDDETTEQAR